MPDVEKGGDCMAHGLTNAAVAIAAMPSSRPVNPRVSDVVALMDI